jgi:FkbM family methyltransferase
MKVKLFFDCEFLTDERNQLQLGKHPYEPDVTHYFETVLQSGDVFVDVGAMIGYYTLLASKRVGWKGHVYAFEPHPDHFSILEKNVKQNRRTRNVTMEQKAVMDFSATKGVLYLSAENAADHRAAYPKQDRETIPVEYVSLDDYFEKGKVDFIKLDIQGSEPYALMGMTKILRNPNIVVVTEFWPEGILQAGWSPTDYLWMLTEHGFGLHTMDGEPREPEWVMANIPGGHTGFMNLLCVRT